MTAATRGAFIRVRTGGDRAADAQLAVLVLGGVRVLGGLGDVLDRHQPAQFVVAIDDQHALQPVPVHQRRGLVQARAVAHGDQPRARRHDVADRRVQPGLEAQVAVGDDADDFLALDHRQAGDLVRALQFQRVAHRHILRQRDGVAQHAGLVALDLQHLGRLLLGRLVLVDDADAPLLRQRDGEPRLGHRVHGGRNQRDVQGDVAGEPGIELHVAGQDRRVGGDEQYVIEGERLLNQPHSVLMTQKRSIQAWTFCR